MGQVLTVTAGLIVLCIAFGFLNPTFTSSKNIANLLRQIAPIILIGIGQSYVIITGNIDLSIGDITQDILTGLPPDITASNFGKISDLASKSDTALGIINLVFQTIGMLSIFAARIHKINDIILTGNLVNVPKSHEIFKILSQLHGVNFHIPDKAEFATAAGAAICFTKRIEFSEIG
jgi:ribose/xylose/arabinose/galactoside ABC-type transport system permease subunit